MGRRVVGEGYSSPTHHTATFASNDAVGTASGSGARTHTHATTTVSVAS